MNKDLFPFSSQLVLSNELMMLMQWLIENHQEELKDLIREALGKGLSEKLDSAKDFGRYMSPESPSEDIAEFFSTLETLYYESSNEMRFGGGRSQQLVTLASKIDSSVCDDTTVEFSLDKASSKMERNPEQDAKDLLGQELLRCWKPHNKKSTH